MNTYERSALEAWRNHDLDKCHEYLFEAWSLRSQNCLIPNDIYHAVIGDDELIDWVEAKNDLEAEETLRKRHNNKPVFIIQTCKQRIAAILQTEKPVPKIMTPLKIEVTNLLIAFTLIALVYQFCILYNKSKFSEYS